MKKMKKQIWMWLLAGWAGMVTNAIVVIALNDPSIPASVFSLTTAITVSLFYIALNGIMAWRTTNLVDVLISRVGAAIALGIHRERRNVVTISFKVTDAQARYYASVLRDRYH